MHQDKIFTKKVIPMVLSMHALSCALLAQFVYIDYIRAIYMLMVEHAFKQIDELEPQSIHICVLGRGRMS